MNIETLTTQLNNGFYQISETGKSFSNKTLNGNKPGSIGFKLTDKNNNEIYVGGWNTESTNIYNTAICLNDVNSEIQHLTLGKNNVEKNTLDVTNTKLLSATKVNNKVKNSNCSIINLSIDNDNIQIPKYTRLLYIPADATEESYAYLLSDTGLDIDPETEKISEKNLKFMPDHSIEYNGKKTNLTWQNIEFPPDDSNMPGVGESLDDEKPKTVKNENNSELFKINCDENGADLPHTKIPVETTTEYETLPNIEFLKFKDTSVIKKDSINVLLAAPNKQSKINYEFQLNNWGLFVDNELNFKYNTFFHIIKIPVYSTTDHKYGVYSVPIFEQIRFHYKNLSNFNNLIFEWNRRVARFRRICSGDYRY